jgi:DNA replication and repair protein RecF
LVETGLVIWRFRANVVSLISPWLVRVHQELAEQADVGIVLANDQVGPELPADATTYQAALQTARTLERIRRLSLIGPHRDEMLITLRGRSAQKYASQGEQRTIALGLRLATFEVFRQEHGETPLMLLDDVLSELDPRRRELLLARVASREQQTVVTDTEVRHFQAFADSIYTVSKGTFAPWT